MTRVQLEHLIRACAAIADDDEIMIIGSQSVLGRRPDVPGSLRTSVKADVYPRTQVERWNLIDGTIGVGSPFHQTFGYYAQGVGPETATLPAGWETRLVAIRNANTRGATGLALDPHDLLLAKYVARRPKDVDFVREAIRAGLVEQEKLLALAEELPVEASARGSIQQLIRADFAGSR